MTGTDVRTYARERPGMSAFVLEDDIVYHTYSTYARGLDGLRLGFVVGQIKQIEKARHERSRFAALAANILLHGSGLRSGWRDRRAHPAARAESGHASAAAEEKPDEFASFHRITSRRPTLLLRVGVSEAAVRDSPQRRGIVRPAAMC
jgi:uncharacterized protein DUF899